MKHGAGYFATIADQVRCLERRMEAILLKLNVIDIRVDLMKARLDHRFDLTDEHLAFIKQY